MSRVIENDHPWSEDEIQYKRDRGLEHEIASNAKEWPPGTVVEKPPSEEDSTPVLQLSQKVYDYVRGRNLTQLQSDLRKAKIEPTGDEPELRVKLAQHLQELEDERSDRNS